MNSSNQNDSGLSKHGQAYWQALLPRMRKMLDSERQKLLEVETETVELQARFINSVPVDDVAYPHLVTLFGDDLTKPNVNEADPAATVALFDLLELIDEKHPARRHFENYIGAAFEHHYISENVSRLEKDFE